MRKLIEKIVKKIFPELTGGLHLDRLARVTAVSDAPDQGAICERFRPRYAVDIEILTPDGEVDADFPAYTAVPLPVGVGCGHEAGLFGFPRPGAVVVVSFAYGRPDFPLIRQIYPHGESLPAVAAEELLLQQSPVVFQRADQAGNWTRETDGTITDDALKRVARAVENLDDYARELRRIAENSTEEVGGTKTVRAMGTLLLKSGGKTDILGVDNINLATARDLTLTVAQDRQEVAGRHHIAQVKGNMEETVVGSRTENVGEDRTESIGGDHTSDVGGDSTEMVDGDKTITAPFINLEATTIRIGDPDSGVSLLPILTEFMEQVRCALHDLSIHTHPALGAAPNNATEIETHSVNVGTLKGDLEGFKG